MAPLPSAVKVLHQDSGATSGVQEEVVVDELARPRPSTVTVIHTGTKWRQVPREVSWETTELWGPLRASWFPAFRGYPASPVPQTFHHFLWKKSKRLEGVMEHQVSMFFFTCRRTLTQTGSWTLTQGSHWPPVLAVEAKFDLACSWSKRWHTRGNSLKLLLCFGIFVPFFSSGQEPSPEKGQGGCSAMMPCVNINMRLCSALWNVQLQAFWVNSRVTSWTLWAPFLSFCFFGLLLCKSDEQLWQGPRILAHSLCCKCVHVNSGQVQGSVSLKARIPLHYCIGIFYFHTIYCDFL